MTPSLIATPATPAALAHFESLYAASEDPWQVRQSWYEQRKRNLLLAWQKSKPGCLHLAIRSTRPRPNCWPF